MTTANIILWLGPLGSNEGGGYGLYCAISGNEPSSVTLYKATAKAIEFDMCDIFFFLSAFFLFEYFPTITRVCMYTGWCKELSKCMYFLSFILQR